MNITFNDMEVSYDHFLNDLASRMVKIMKQEADRPEQISQREAFRLFGRANVERWRATGKIIPIKRPGRLLYNYSELHALSLAPQDYLDTITIDKVKVKNKINTFRT